MEFTSDQIYEKYITDLHREAKRRADEEEWTWFLELLEGQTPERVYSNLVRIPYPPGYAMSARDLNFYAEASDVVWVLPCVHVNEDKSLSVEVLLVDGYNPEEGKVKAAKRRRDVRTGKKHLVEVSKEQAQAIRDGELRALFLENGAVGDQISIAVTDDRRAWIDVVITFWHPPNLASIAVQCWGYGGEAS